MHAVVLGVALADTVLNDPVAHLVTVAHFDHLVGQRAHLAPGRGIGQIPGLVRGVQRPFVIAVEPPVQAAIEAVSKKPLDRTYEKSHLMNRLQEVLYCNEAFDDYIRLPNTTLDGHCISDVELQAFVQRFYISKAGSLQVHVVGGDHRVSQESVVLSFTLNGYRRYAGAAGVRGSLGLSQPASMDLFENWNKKFN